MSKLLTNQQQNEPLVNYLRIHRRRLGLSQREMGRVLGYKNEGAVSRHEKFNSLPPLLVALGYEIVFQSPVSEIFAGLHETVEFAVEKHLAEFESHLLSQNSNSSRPSAVTRKLEWLSKRRSSGYK
jgi:DNA-binding XRE family transcriptional regulator